MNGNFHVVKKTYLTDIVNDIYIFISIEMLEKLNSLIFVPTDYIKSMMFS